MTVGFALVVGIFIPTTLFSLHTYRRIHQEFEALKKDILPEAILMMEMETIATETHRHLMEYLMHAATEAQEEKEARSGIKRLGSAALEHLEHETHIGEQEKAEGRQLVAKVARFTSAGIELIDMKKRGASLAEMSDKEMQILHPADEALIEQVRSHKAVHMAELAGAEQAVRSARKTGVALVVAAGICAALAAIAVALLTTRSVTKPIRALQEGTRRIATGDLDYRMHMERKDEFGQLGAAFDRMSEDLSKTLVSREELAEANRELGRFNRLAVGREMRMVELKQENNELARQLGREPSYDPSLLAEDVSKGAAGNGA